MVQDVWSVHRVSTEEWCGFCSCQLSLDSHPGSSSCCQADAEVRSNELRRSSLITGCKTLVGCKISD
jgi:hypothetical protein